MKTKTLLLSLLVFISTLGFSQIFEKQGGGITVIVHGWNPNDNQPAWMTEMANAIIARSGGSGQIGTITVTGTAGNLTATCTNWSFNLASENSTEVVILVNWTAVANNLTFGVTAQEVAAVVAPKIYESQNSQPPLAELPLHLIGHSRGGGMVFEIARLLGLQGIEVEQVTALDPHPLTSADPQPIVGSAVIDTPIKLHENILFVDNYYQNIKFPKGQYLNGAYNRLWTSMTGGYHNETGYTYSILGVGYNFSDHLNVILMYHGTIDLTNNYSNGEATISETERNAWFNNYEMQGEKTGFHYSRNILGNRKSVDTPVADGDKIIAGYHNNTLLGGEGTREEITWTNAVWSNILTANVLKNTTVLESGSQSLVLGENIKLKYNYRSYANACTVKFYMDTDRNPYNETKILISTQNNNKTESVISQLTANWTVENLVIGGKYYIYAEISDATRTRFMYLDYEFNVKDDSNIEDNNLDEISIYPNPTSEKLNLNLGDNKVKQITISTITGKQILVITNLTKNETIDLSKLESGIYLINIQTNTKTITKKIIKH